jgi:hypothetical protein
MHKQDKDRKLERTSTPGVFRRHAKDCSRRGRCDCSYVVTFRDRGLGHHKPSFTIDTYIHLLDGDLGDPLEPVRVNAGSTQRP